MKFSSFATDLNLEESGVWVDLGDGARLKLARIGNPAYKKLMREKLKPYRTQAARAGISEDKFTEMTCDVLSKTVLIDWKGWEDDKGKEIPYSHKNAYDRLPARPVGRSAYCLGKRERSGASETHGNRRRNCPNGSVSGF